MFQSFKPISPALQKDFSACLTPVESTQELVAALKKMDSNKICGSLGITLKHLLNDLTCLMFTGEIPPSLRHGTINPYVKDHHRFRAINLLKPIYKLVSGAFSTRLNTAVFLAA